MSDQFPPIRILPARITITFFALTVLLVVLSIAGQYIKYTPGAVDIRGPVHEYFIDLLMQEFFLDSERSVPTYFNVLLLILPAFLLYSIAGVKSNAGDKYRRHWMALALIFLLLSVDEMVGFHETLIKPIRSIMGAGGFLYFAWVVPGIAAVVLFGIVFLRFFLHLEHKFKLLFCFSLALYITGAIGGEMISGHYAALLGQRNLTYAVVASLEESIEVSGAILISYSLFKYIETYFPEFSFLVKSGA